MKRTKAGAGFTNPVPRFRRRKGSGKNQACQWFKSGDFPRCARKNTTRPLTVWIVGADEISHLRSEKEAE